MGLRHTIYLDYRRYCAEGAGNLRDVILFNQGFWAICLYRVGHHLLKRTKNRFLKKLIGFSFALARTVSEIITGIGLPVEAEIGEGLCIFHYGPTTVATRARIGKNCNLRQGVTIGIAGRGEDRGAPTIGDRVDIGVYAIIVGKITIGDDAVISAGAFVTKSVPPRGVVAGNPARLLSYQGSFDFLSYDGMEEDPARIEALSRDPSANTKA